jgi:hypothetical protein
LPTVFFRHSAKRSLCQLEFPAVGKAGFADCLALPTARQLAKPWLCRLPGSWQRIAVGKGRPWLTPSTPSPLPTATPSAVGKGAGFADCHPPWQSAKALCQLPLMAVGKELIFFSIFDPSFFVLPCYSKYMIYSKFGVILIYFAIFH